MKLTRRDKVEIAVLFSPILITAVAVMLLMRICNLITLASLFVGVLVGFVIAWMMDR